MLVPEEPEPAPPLPIWNAAVTMATAGPPDWFPYGVPVDPVHHLPILTAPDLSSMPIVATAFDKRGSAPDVGATLLHFYVQDQKLRTQLLHPQSFVQSLALAWGITSPDFSMWADAPRDLRILSVRMNRMLGAYYQSRGLRVVPSLRWIDSNDYDFCFAGVEIGSAVSVSTHGLWQAGKLRQGFLNGLHEAVERIEPRAIFVYGTVNHVVFRDIARKTDLVHFEDDRTRARKRAA